MNRNVLVTGPSVPVFADAVLMNVTATQTTATSYLSIWPNGQAQPTVSSLNWVAGWTIPVEPAFRPLYAAPGFASASSSPGWSSACRNP